MGAQQKTVGGGNATPVANSFNDFLMQQLNGGGGQQATNGNQIQALQGILKLPGANQAAIQSEINRLQSNNAQPSQQGNSAFQNLFGQMASGQVNDQSGAGAQLQRFFGQYGGGDAGVQGGPLPTFQNTYQNQQFQGFNPSQLATNFGQGQTGMANLSGIPGVQDTNFNVMQGFGTQGGQSQFTNMLNQSMQGLQGLGQGAAAPVVALDPARQIDLNSPEIQAQQAIADRQRMMAVADQRARFGADGSGSLGTGAQVAEGNLNATFGPQMAALLQQNIAQQQQADLAQRQAKAGVALGSAGQQLQASMSNANNQLQGGLGGMNALLGARGQDFSNQTANRGMDINQLGLGLNQAQGNQAAQLQGRGQDINALLQNQNMGNQFGLGAFNANSANQQQNNANGMNMAGMQNQFNLNNAGNMAQYGQGANQLNLQSALGGQNNLLQAIQMGLGQNQLGNANQMGVLGQLFGGFGQANQLGTPGAQTVMQPSGWGQAAQGLLGLGTAALGGPAGGAIGGWLGNMFGGGGSSGMPSMPSFSPNIGNTTWGSGPTTQYNGPIVPRSF